MHTHPFSAALFLLGCAMFANAANAPSQITVSAGDYDRRDSIVRFALPPDAGQPEELKDEQGDLIPVQTDNEAHGWFIEKDLKRGSKKVYRVVAHGRKSDPRAGVQVVREGSRVKVAIGDKPVFYYQAEMSELPRPDIKPALQRGGYLHPILTPSGKLLTDDYPPNHLHHHGVWFSWAHTEFEGRQPDFWNMGDAKGTTEFVALERTWSGPVHGGFQSEHRYVDLTTPGHKVALNETWVVTVYNVGTGSGRYWMFDLVSTQTCAGGFLLKLPQYRYGGIGFRGNREWNGKDNTLFLTSEGETHRDKGNETRGRWCHISGRVGDQLAGVAILCHPYNFRAPQPMRLHPTEPFFCFAPQQAGDMGITPARPYVSRYRFIVADGAPDRDELERFWNDYAHPVAAQLD